MGRRTAEGKQTVPVTVKVSDGEGSNNMDNADVSVVAAEADVAREQFPFIFNLLRGHAINTRGLGPRVAGQVSAESIRSKTSPHHQQQQQQQQQLQQLQARKPAVATCRQHQATPSGRGRLSTCLSLHSFSQ